MKKKGFLFFNNSIGRYDVVFPGEGNYGGLHCGNVFDILVNGAWEPTRIEHNGEDWYLVGFEDLSLEEQRVRM